MATSFINDPEHWRNRAEEAHTLADQMSDEMSKQTMLRIAADYADALHKIQQSQSEIAAAKTNAARGLRAALRAPPWPRPGRDEARNPGTNTAPAAFPTRMRGVNYSPAPASS